MAVGLPFNPYQRFNPFVAPEEQQGQNMFPATSVEQQQVPDQPETFDPSTPQQQPASQQDNAPANDGFDWGDYQSDDALARRHKLAQAIMGQQQEVHSPWQALGNVAAQLSGAWMEKKATDAENSQRQKHTQFMKSSLDSAGGDMDKFIQSLMSSPDPADVEMGIQYQMAALKNQSRSRTTDIIDVFGEDGKTRRKALVDKNTGEILRYVGGEAPMYKPSSGGDASGGDASMDDDGSGSNPLFLDNNTADFLAERILAGDKSAAQNLGRGKAGARNSIMVQKAVARKAAEIDPKTGKPRFNARQVAAAQYNLQGYGAGMRTSNVQRAKMVQRAHEAKNMMGLVIKYSDAVPRSEYSDLAWIENEFRSRSGDTKITQFATSLNALVNSYAAAISPNGGTVADKEHARDILSTSMSQGQIRAGIAVLQQEIDAAIASPGQTMDDQQEAWNQDSNDLPIEEVNTGGKQLPRTSDGKVDASSMEEGVEYDAGPRHPGKKLVKRGGKVYQVN